MNLSSKQKPESDRCIVDGSAEEVIKKQRNNTADMSFQENDKIYKFSYEPNTAD